MSDHQQTLNPEKTQSKKSSIEDGSRSGPAGAGAVAVGAQALISCAPLLASGLDTIVLSLSLKIPAELLAELKEAKEKIQLGKDMSALWQPGQTKLFSWELSRSGRNLFPYVLRQGDITLSLSNRPSDSPIPNGQLSIGSLSSNNNPSDLLAMIKKWCLLYGIIFVKETVSRVDLYADFEVAIQKQHLSSQSRIVTRACKIANYFSNRKLSGVQVGTSSIVLRCYDKLLEMQEKQATTKQEFFTTLWGRSPDHVTRVEYQLRREALHDFFRHSCTFAELTAKIPDLWAYLTSEWFRLASRPVDRENRHQDREPVSPFWFAVQCAFNLFSPVAIRIKRLKVFNVQALIRQAGCIMVTIAAGLGFAYEDLPDIYRAMDDTIGRQVETILVEKGEKDYYRRAALAKITI